MPLHIPSLACDDYEMDASWRIAYTRLRYYEYTLVLILVLLFTLRLVLVIARLPSQSIQ